MKRIQLLMVLGLTILLSGCVTTTEGGFDNEGDEQEKIDQYVATAAEYIRRGKPEGAKRHLQEALKLDPKSATAHGMLAQAFWNTSEMSLADKHFRKMVSYDPDYTAGRYNYGLFLFVAQQDYEGAKREFLAAAEDTLYRKRSKVFSSLGYVYLKMNDKLAAKGAFEKAVKINVADRAGLFELSRLEYELANYEMAKFWYERLRMSMDEDSVKQPVPPSVLLLGARVHGRMGETDKAEDLGMALRSLYPDSSEYKDYQREFGG